ncbi:hypothetical protein WDX82_005125 [Salmonella enterica]
MKGLKNQTAQISIGLWLAMAAFFGTMTRSWETFGAFLAVAVFFGGLGFAGVFISGELFKRSGLKGRFWTFTDKAVRALGYAYLAFFFIGIAAALVGGLERLYLVNGDSYPRFLAKNLGTADMHTIDALRAKECKGESIDVYEKTGNVWVIRCGFSWIDGKTYVSNADPYRELRKEAAQ